MTILREPPVLALHSFAAGFGYAVFEGVQDPVDWGTKKVAKTSDDEFMQQMRWMLHVFHPSVLVLQDCRAHGLMPCSGQSKRRIAKVMALANRKNITVRRYTRRDIRACFAYYGVRSKDEIARAIAKVLPEFERYVPPMRGDYKSEGYHMSMFDALSLVLTYYAKEFLRPERM